MHDLKDRVAFITGGSSGIGLGIALACGAAGMKVAMGYRSETHRRRAVDLLERAGVEVHPVSIDVTDRDQVMHAAYDVLDRFGKVHLLVNNAGVFQVGPIQTATHEDWDWLVSTNLTGVFNGIHVFLPLLLRNKEGGHILTTASAWGLVPEPNGAIYSTTKAALIAMMEALHGELQSLGIGVSVFCPGPVATELGDSDRNRPGGIRTEDFKPSEAAPRNPILAEVQIDAFEAGRIALQGVIDDDLHIMTHAEYEAGIRERFEALIVAVPTEAPANQIRRAMLQANATFRQERDRRNMRNRSARPNEQI